MSFCASLNIQYEWQLYVESQVVESGVAEFLELVLDTITIHMVVAYIVGVVTGGIADLITKDAYLLTFNGRIRSLHVEQSLSVHHREAVLKVAGQWGTAHVSRGVHS
jgi:hypothetical protein